MNEKLRDKTILSSGESHEISHERARGMILGNILRPDKRDKDSLILWAFKDPVKESLNETENKKRDFVEALDLIKSRKHREALVVYPDLILELIRRRLATLEERKESSFKCTDKELPTAPTGKPQKYSIRIKLLEGAFDFLEKLPRKQHTADQKR